MESMQLMQLIGGGGDMVSSLLWFIMFMVFIFFYPRLMLYQLMMKLDASARKLESMNAKNKEFLCGEIQKSPSKVVRDSVHRFMEFFAISPVSLDPYGIVGKFDHLLRQENVRFRYFIDQLVPKANEERKANLRMGLAGGIELNMITKIVRHYIEMAKKTKSYQIALILQMQLPLIEKIAKSLYKGSRSLARGEPIGDSIGPLFIAGLMGDSKYKEIEEDIIAVEKAVFGKKAVLVKARGPGGRIGYPGKAVAGLLKKGRYVKIITIDAAAKLEGEKTGSVAEGIGVAMGGVGVERSYIEDVAVKSNIPIDSIIIKMAQEEAIQTMRKSIKDALPEAAEALKRSLETVKKHEKVIIIGVGNTSGVGNGAKDADTAKRFVDSYEKRRLAEKKRKKQKEDE